MLQIEPKRTPFFLTDDYELFDNSPIKSRNCFPFARIQSRLWTTIWLTGGYMASRHSSDLTCDFHLHVLEASICMNKVLWSPSPWVRVPKRGSKTRAGGAGIVWTQRLRRTPCRPDSHQTPSLTPFKVPRGQENNHPGSVWSCDPQCKKRELFVARQLIVGVATTSPILVEVIVSTRVMVMMALILLLPASLSSREVPPGIYGVYIPAISHVLAMNARAEASLECRGKWGERHSHLIRQHSSKHIKVSPLLYGHLPCGFVHVT